MAILFIPQGYLASDNDAAAKIRASLAKDLKEGKPEALANNIAIGGFFLACAIAIIGAIVVWIDEGFWSFVGYAIIGFLLCTMEGC